MLTKPTHSIDFDLITESLKSRPRWICWDYESKDGNTWAKIPKLATDPRRNASSTDPATWTTFEIASQSSTANGIGAGFVLGDGIVGIDIDDCRDSVTGKLADWALDIVELVGGYWEVSPSGTGIKGYARGFLPAGIRKKHPRPDGSGCVEVYENGRYFTVTGQKIEGSPSDIQAGQDEIDGLLAVLETWRPKQPTAVAVPDQPVASTDRERQIERARAYLAVIPGAIQGQRGSDCTFNAALHAASFGLSRDDCFAVMWEWNVKCEPVWSEAELWHKVEDALKVCNTRKPDRDSLPVDDGFRFPDEAAPTQVAIFEPAQVTESVEDDEDEQPEAQVEPIELDFPAECLRPPGLMGDFVDYALNTAKYPQPIHAAAGAYTLMSLITGRRVADLNDTRTNLMLVSVGPTRSGKEYPRQIIKNILVAVGRSGMYEEKVASAPALHDYMKSSYAGLLMCDEFGDWLALARSTKGQNTQPAQILTAMLKLYSSSNAPYKADRNKDNSRQAIIDQPHLVFLGTTTGDIFWKHVTPDYLAGGLFGRIMVLENDGYVLPTSMRGKDRRIPDQIISEVRAWLNTPSNDGEIDWQNPHPIIVPHSSDAIDRFEAHELAIAKRRVGESAIEAALWSGTAEFTAKLALLCACSRSRNPLQIQIEDVDRAIRMSNWLTRRKIALCADHVAENAVEDAVKRVFRIIKATQAKGIGQYELTRKTQWLKDRDRQEIIQTLKVSKQIATREVKTKTKTKIVLVAGRYASVGNIKLDQTTA